MKERTIEDYEKMEEELNQYGKNYVATAFNLPEDYFVEKDLLVDVDQVADFEDFEDSRIEKYERENIGIALEKWLMRLHERMVFGENAKLDTVSASRGVLAFCLRNGLIDCKPLTLEKTVELLGISSERVRMICSKIERMIRRVSLNNDGDIAYGLDKDSEKSYKLSGVKSRREDLSRFKRFKNYGELLEFYIENEKDAQRKEKLNNIYADYQSIGKGDRFVIEK